MAASQNVRQLETPSSMGRILRVKPETVRKYAAEGRIPVIRISSKAIRFDAEEVLRTIRQGR